jgi:transketolase
MLNSDLHLHDDIFDWEKLPMASMRDAIGEALVELGEKDERVVVLSADVSESVRVDAFKKKFPKRYVEVAEQNLAGLAAGLANVGKIPFIVTFAVFSPGRNWEQIRTTIALSDLPVKIIGTHTGVGAGADGATHQALEDITLMRVLPNMQLYVPADKEEARKALLASVGNKKPTYIRIARHETPVFTTEDTPFEIGHAEYLWHSKHAQVAFIGAGPLLYDALKVAKRLDGEGIGTSVLNVHSVRPMDMERREMRVP